MKKKLLPLLLAFVLGAQPLLACEWCGQKGAQHGMVVNTLATLAYVMRSFANFQDFGNYWENREIAESTNEEESLPPSNDTEPEPPAPAIILIPRNEANLAALTAAARRGEIFLAVDESMYGEDDGTPAPIEETHYYGLENPIAYRLSIVLCARALLNLDLEELQKEDQDQDIHQLLKHLFERIEALELSTTTTPDLIANVGEDFLRESLSNISTYWIERLDSLLSELWAEHDTLPEEQQIPQADLDILEEPSALDSTWTLMLARCWRNFFMAAHLRKLQDCAQGVPIVALLDKDHIKDLKKRLHDIEIASTTKILSRYSKP